MSDHDGDEALGAVWASIEQAAYDQAVAEVEEDDQRGAAARERSASAVAEAIRLGQALSEITAHAAAGHRRATEELGKSLLKAAASSARRLKEAQAVYDRDVRRAGLLLPDREVAGHIGVSPGTVRAIIRRAATAGAAPEESEGEQHAQAPEWTETDQNHDS